MEPILLLIDTSTDICSAALAQPDRILDSMETDEHHAHVSRLAVFIDSLLKRNHLVLNQCAGVAVSEGPGSYTGLRVGVSTAKGLCYASQLPLLAVGSLTMLAHRYLDCLGHPAPDTRIVPMIDARRMEVYTAVFSAQGEQIRPTEAKIIDAGSFGEFLEQGPVCFIGDGASKCRDVIKHPRAQFVDLQAHACGMRRAAFEALKNKRYQDIAYFTPFYLKNFVATACKASLLQRLPHPHAKS